MPGATSERFDAIPRENDRPKIFEKGLAAGIEDEDDGCGQKPYGLAWREVDLAFNLKRTTRTHCVATSAKRARLQSSCPVESLFM